MNFGLCSVERFDLKHSTNAKEIMAIGPITRLWLPTCGYVNAAAKPSNYDKNINSRRGSKITIFIVE